MLDLIRLFSGGADWVPLIFAFVALPGIYVYLAIDVHKEYAEFAKFSADKGPLSDLKIVELESIMDDRLAMFELDWWVVAATAVLLAMIALLPQLLYSSIKTASLCSTTQFQRYLGNVSECDRQTSFLRLYCVGVGLAVAFRIAWARVGVAQNLKSLYLRSRR